MSPDEKEEREPSRSPQGLKEFVSLLKFDEEKRGGF